MRTDGRKVEGSWEDRELEQLVQAARDAQVVVPREHLDRLQDVVRCQLKASRPAVRRFPSRAILSGVVAASIVVALVWLLWKPHTSLAEVVQAARARPWLRATANTPQGKHVLWLSLARDIAAQDRGETVVFDDYRLSVRYEYDPVEHKLFRVPLPDPEGFEATAGVFQAILNGQEAVGNRFDHAEIVEQSRRVVRLDQQEWVEHDLILRPGGGDPQRAPLARLVLRVDPIRKLPMTMTLKQLVGVEGAADTDHDQPLEITYTIDYPSEGPVDIYALGVPRTTELVDRVPPPDVARIQKVIAANLDRFDSYLAVVTREMSGPSDRPSIACVVWRSGKRLRVELCSPGAQFPEQPPTGADPGKWWHDQLPSYERVPALVCDGRTVYHADLESFYQTGKSQWEAAKTIRASEPLSEYHLSIVRGNFAEFFAYRRLGSSRHAGLSLDVEPQGGPAGCVLLTAANSRYWLDPEQGFAARRIQHHFENSQDHVYELDGYRPSPNGIWYPTRVRWRNSVDRDGDGLFETDQILRFYLDFDAQLSPDLFRAE